MQRKIKKLDAYQSLKSIYKSGFRCGLAIYYMSVKHDGGAGRGGAGRGVAGYSTFCTYHALFSAIYVNLNIQMIFWSRLTNLFLKDTLASMTGSYFLWQAKCFL